MVPSGKFYPNPGAMQVVWTPDEDAVVSTKPAECPDGDCLQVFQEMLEEAVSVPVAF